MRGGDDQDRHLPARRPNRVHQLDPPGAVRLASRPDRIVVGMQAIAAVGRLDESLSTGAGDRSHPGSDTTVDLLGRRQEFGTCRSPGVSGELARYLAATPSQPLTRSRSPVCRLSIASKHAIHVAACHRKLGRLASENNTRAFDEVADPDRIHWPIGPRCWYAVG